VKLLVEVFLGAFLARDAAIALLRKNALFRASAYRARISCTNILHDRIANAGKSCARPTGQLSPNERRLPGRDPSNAGAGGVSERLQRLLQSAIPTRAGRRCTMTKHKQT